MNYLNLAQEINDLTKAKIKLNESMKKWTSFKVGGKADIIVLVDEISQLKGLVNYLKENKIPYFIIGHGTNLLIKDEGVKGVVIKLVGSFKRVSVAGNEIQAGAGVSLSKLLKISLKHNLSGLEFVTGIPGSVGGSLIMNAGIPNCSLGEVTKKVRILTSKGEEVTLENKDIDFFYRGSSLNGSIVLGAEFSLERASQELILEKVKKYQEKRTFLSFPNAGSIFKNPREGFAGELIEKVGLKGYTIGKAQVSTQHANFIQNIGQAKAGDILSLIEKIKEAVQSQFGVHLEMEIKIIGGNGWLS
ncbi:UDP-N-acetylmuramate dehydrogenase [bacterium]|nr:UDP-N-acetylmuramate dehydrogenase [bacterium]